jgi:hypothetical protein
LIAPEETAVECSIEEQIANLDSYGALAALINQRLNDSENEKHNSVRRQVGGIMKTLKKGKAGEIEKNMLILRAKNILRSNLL